MCFNMILCILAALLQYFIICSEEKISNDNHIREEKKSQISVTF